MSNALHRLIASLASVLHPYTLGRSLMAVIRGAGIAIAAVQGWVSADDRAHLRAQNAVKHDRITRNRAWAAGIGASLDVVLLLACWYVIGWRAGASLWTLVHLGVLFAIGHNGPVLHHVISPYIVGETRLKRHVDEITATPESRKLEERASIVSPLVQLAERNGWEATVRVPEHANPIKLTEGAESLEHRMQKPKGTVFVYQQPGDVSTFRVLALDANPWAGPATSNPLVLQPRPVNLWREQVEIGSFPDASPYSRWFVRSGVGGSALFGAAPGMGKSVLNLDLMLPIMLHTGSRIHLIDGKGVDFTAISSVCETYLADPEMSGADLLMKSIAVLQKLEAEITRRRVLFASLGKAGVTEELCAEHGITLEWLVIDELAVINEDMIAVLKDPDDEKAGTFKSEVLEFNRLLIVIAKLGRAFGVYALLSTQRPTEKSVPPALKGIITGFRASLYIADVHGSHAILGKAGPELRADKLDPEQHGVGIVVGIGQVRFHNIEPEDLPAVVQYVLDLRAQSAPKIEDYPEPVRSVLEIFAAEGDPMELPTWAILKGLISIGLDYSAISLAAELKPLGIAPTNVGPKREKGYRRAQLIAARPAAQQPAAPGLATRSGAADEPHSGGLMSGLDDDYSESRDWPTDDDQENGS